MKYGKCKNCKYCKRFLIEQYESGFEVEADCQAYGKSFYRVVKACPQHKRRHGIRRAHWGDLKIFPKSNEIQKKRSSFWLLRDIS